MPIYEYRCGECAQVFEEFQRGFEERDANCPVCGCKSDRLISNTSFVLKGTGWYVTDYQKSGNASAAAAKSSSGTGEDKPAPSEAAAAKSETSAAPAPAACAADHSS